MPVTLCHTACGHFIGNRYAVYDIHESTFVTNTGLPIKQIVVIADAEPALLDFTNLSIIGLAVFHKQAAILGLADIDAGFTEVIVEAIDLMYTG